jgi:hypothetical protein
MMQEQRDTDWGHREGDWDPEPTTSMRKDSVSTRKESNSEKMSQPKPKKSTSEWRTSEAEGQWYSHVRSSLIKGLESIENTVQKSMQETVTRGPKSESRDPVPEDGRDYNSCSDNKPSRSSWKKQIKKVRTKHGSADGPCISSLNGTLKENEPVPVERGRSKSRQRSGRGRSETRRKHRSKSRPRDSDASPREPVPGERCRSSRRSLSHQMRSRSKASSKYTHQEVVQQHHRGRPATRGRSKSRTARSRSRKHKEEQPARNDADQERKTNMSRAEMKATETQEQPIEMKKSRSKKMSSQQRTNAAEVQGNPQKPNAMHTTASRETEVEDKGSTQKFAKDNMEIKRNDTEEKDSLHKPAIINKHKEITSEQLASNQRPQAVKKQATNGSIIACPQATQMTRSRSQKNVRSGLLVSNETTKKEQLSKTTNNRMLPIEDPILAEEGIELVLFVSQEGTRGLLIINAGERIMSPTPNLLKLPVRRTRIHDVKPVATKKRQATLGGRPNPKFKKSLKAPAPPETKIIGRWGLQKSNKPDGSKLKKTGKRERVQKVPALQKNSGSHNGRPQARPVASTGAKLKTSPEEIEAMIDTIAKFKMTAATLGMAEKDLLEALA